MIKSTAWSNLLVIKAKQTLEIIQVKHNSVLKASLVSVKSVKGNNLGLAEYQIRKKLEIQIGFSGLKGFQNRVNGLHFDFSE